MQRPRGEFRSKKDQACEVPAERRGRGQRGPREERLRAPRSHSNRSRVPPPDVQPTTAPVHPHPIRGPSLPPGPEGAAFSGPPPPGTTRALALGLRGIKESLSALAQDTCTVHTQALMTFNTCLSQPRSPAPALGVPSPVFPAQRPSSCPLRSMQLGRPGASGVCPCYLPSHLEGGSCRGLIPLGTGTIQSGPPPSCSVWS